MTTDASAVAALRPRRKIVYRYLAALPQRLDDRKSLWWRGSGPADRAPDELLLGRLHDAVRRRNTAPVGSEGTLYITDRRAVLIARHRQVLGEWRFTDDARVNIMKDFVGVEFSTSADQADVDCVVRLRKSDVAHRTRDPIAFSSSIEMVWLQLLRTEAAWVLATGRDWNAWLSLLPARLGA